MMMMSVYVFAKNFFAIEWLVQPETARNEQEKEGGVGYKISIIEPLQFDGILAVSICQ